MEFDNILESEVRENEKLVKRNNQHKGEIKRLTIINVLLAILTILFIAISAYLYFFKLKKNTTQQATINPNFIQVHKDSLQVYKTTYFNVKNDSSSGIDDQAIIYSVQLGAFRDFEINSAELMNLQEFKVDGYNKYTIGYFTKYADAVNLRDRLTQFGFNDCFITARSFGNAIDIQQALTLSNELEYLE